MKRSPQCGAAAKAAPMASLVREKIPLLALAAGFSVLNLCQPSANAGAVAGLAEALRVRATTERRARVRRVHLAGCFWPVNLSTFLLSRVTR